MKENQLEVEEIFFNDGSSNTSLSALGRLFTNADYVFIDMFVHPTNEYETLMADKDVYDTIDVLSVHVLLKSGAKPPKESPDNFVFYETRQRSDFSKQVKLPDMFPYNTEIHGDNLSANGMDIHIQASMFVQHMRSDAVFIASNKERIINDGLESGYCILFSNETVFSPSLLGSPIYELTIKTLRLLSDG